MAKVSDILSGLAATVRDLESRTARGLKAASGPAMHFDWWAFPVNSTSGYGDKYSVGDAEIAALQSNGSFQENYHKMIGLYFKSMGWDIESGTKIAGESLPSDLYGVRLAKCLLSMKLFGEDKYYNNALKFLGAVAPVVRADFCSEFDWSLAGHDDAFTRARRDAKYIKKADGRTPDGFEVFRQNKDKFGYIDRSGVARVPDSVAAASRYPVVAAARPSSDYVPDDIPDDVLAQLIAGVSVASTRTSGGHAAAMGGRVAQQVKPSIMGRAGIGAVTPRPDLTAAKARTVDRVIDIDPEVMKSGIMECCSSSGNRIDDKQVDSFVSLASDQLAYLGRLDGEQLEGFFADQKSFGKFEKTLKTVAPDFFRTPGRGAVK